MKADQKNPQIHRKNKRKRNKHLSEFRPNTFVFAVCRRYCYLCGFASHHVLRDFLNAPAINSLVERGKLVITILKKRESIKKK